MLQIFMILFCTLPNGKSKSIENVSLKNNSVYQTITASKQMGTTEHIVNITSDVRLGLKNEQNNTLNNNILKIVKVLNDTSVNKHLDAMKVTQQAHILYKIHATITRSKDAIWATITLTFMCVLLVLAVAQSKMWKDYNGSESQGVPLPNFNERVLFKDVMERRMTSLKEMFKKKKKSVSELESLLPTTEWE